MARNIVSGFLSIFSARVATVVITFLTTPVLVRLLGGPAAYGDYKFLMSWFALLMILVSSGVTDGVQKFVGESGRFRNWEEYVIGFYVRTAVALAFAGAAAVVFTATLPSITRTFGEQFDFYLLLLAVLVFTAQFRTLVQRALRGLELERYSEPLRILDTGIWAVGSIALVWAGYGVAAVLFAHIAGSLAVAVVGFALISREVSLLAVFRSTPDYFPTRELLSFNGWSVVMILFMTSLYKVDMIMVRTFLTNDLTGQYAAALSLAEHLWIVPLSIQGIFIHSSSSLWSERRVRAINRLASKTTRYTLMVSTLMAIGVAALADAFIPVYYGPGFENAVLPLLLLLPGTVALAVVRPIYAIGQGSGTLKPIVVATGSAAILNVVLNAVLIPQFGIVGAAIATSVGYTVMFPLHVWSAHRVGFDPLQDVRPVRVLVTTIVAAVPIYATSRIVDGPLTFAVVPIVGIVAYGLAAIATGAVTVSEILDVGSSFPGFVGSSARSLQRSTETKTNGPPFSRILTLFGVLLFATGIALSITGTFVPGSGPSAPDIGPVGTSTNQTTTTPVQTTTPTTGTTTDSPFQSTSTTSSGGYLTTSTSTSDGTTSTTDTTTQDTTTATFGTTTTPDTTTSTTDTTTDTTTFTFGTTTTTTADTTTTTTDTTTQDTTTTTDTTTSTTDTTTTTTTADTTTTTADTTTTTTTTSTTSDTTNTTTTTTTTSLLP